jgi:hypothetical protein
MNNNLIYEEKYYNNRVDLGFIKNIKLFETKKIIWIFHSLTYRFNNKNKKIINFKIFNNYNILNVDNNIVLNKKALYECAKKYFKLDNFITFPICIFKNITIEGILLINEKYSFLDETKLLLNKLYLTNNLTNNKEIIQNILNYKFNKFDDIVKLNIDGNYLTITIQLLLESIIPYF